MIALFVYSLSLSTTLQRRVIKLRLISRTDAVLTAFPEIAGRKFMYTEHSAAEEGASVYRGD